mmetsp:Transcript_47289/g.107232  ORF Transcript_47289/g.107232 Transcript_47289/m.107232 type:complete len:205 (+) Transcript_47289:1046-1660(+)
MFLMCFVVQADNAVLCSCGVCLFARQKLVDHCRRKRPRAPALCRRPRSASKRALFGMCDDFDFQCRTGSDRVLYLIGQRDLRERSTASSTAVSEGFPCGPRDLRGLRGKFLGAHLPRPEAAARSRVGSIFKAVLVDDLDCHNPSGVFACLRGLVLSPHSQTVHDEFGTNFFGFFSYSLGRSMKRPSCFRSCPLCSVSLSWAVLV